MIEIGNSTLSSRDRAGVVDRCFFERRTSLLYPGRLSLYPDLFLSLLWCFSRGDRSAIAREAVIFLLPPGDIRHDCSGGAASLANLSPGRERLGMREGRVALKDFEK